MKISIITASLNAAEHIQSLINSIKSQSYQDIEHIIVDGLSGDLTLSIIDNNRDDHYQPIVLSEADGGVNEAFNKGLALATGDIINIMGADDIYYSPNTLALVAHQIGDADYLHGGTIVRELDGSTRPWPGVMIPICHQAIFATRHSYDLVGHYRTDIGIWADPQWMHELTYHPELTGIQLADTLVYFRAGGISDHRRIKTATP